LMYAVALAKITALLGFAVAGRSSMSAPSHMRGLGCRSGMTRRKLSIWLLTESRYFRSTSLCGIRFFGFVSRSSTLSSMLSSGVRLIPFRPLVCVACLVCRRPFWVEVMSLLLDILSLRFEFIRGFSSIGLLYTSSAAISIPKRAVSMVESSSAASLKRNGAHPPLQVEGLGGVPSFPLFGHSGDVQHAERLSG
jgi:hypothetical protein